MPLGTLSGGGSSDSVTVSGGSTDNYLLTGLQNGDTYTISVASVADLFTSESVRADMAVGLGKCVYVVCYSVFIILMVIVT